MCWVMSGCFWLERDFMIQNVVESRYLTLSQAAKESGYTYESFLKVYTPLLTKHGVQIYRLPGAKRKLIDRKGFYQLIEASRIN